MKQSMLKTNKSKGNEYFKSTRIESCSHIKMVNGKTFAVPFIPQKKQTYADKMQKSSLTTSVNT